MCIRGISSGTILFIFPTTNNWKNNIHAHENANLAILRNINPIIRILRKYPVCNKTSNILRH